MKNFFLSVGFLAAISSGVMEFIDSSNKRYGSAQKPVSVIAQN